MRVRFTDEAKNKLHAIRSHIAEHSSINADGVIDRILRRTEQVGQYPHVGRRVPEYRLDTLREVLERPYRIIYRIRPDAIEVVSVMHYRQLLPGDLAREFSV